MHTRFTICIQILQITLLYGYPWMVWIFHLMPNHSGLKKCGSLIVGAQIL